MLEQKYLKEGGLTKFFETSFLSLLLDVSLLTVCRYILCVNVHVCVCFRSCAETK